MKLIIDTNKHKLKVKDINSFTTRDIQEVAFAIETFTNHVANTTNITQEDIFLLKNFFQERINKGFAKTTTSIPEKVFEDFD